MSAPLAATSKVKEEFVTTIMSCSLPSNFTFYRLKETEEGGKWHVDVICESSNEIIPLGIAEIDCSSRESALECKEAVREILMQRGGREIE